jgi:hypothetical protein
MSSQYARYRDSRGRTVRVQANTTFRGSPFPTHQSKHYWRGDSYVPSGYYPIDFNTWFFLAAVTADDYCDTDVQPETLYGEVDTGYNTDTGYAEQNTGGEHGYSQDTSSNTAHSDTSSSTDTSSGYSGGYSSTDSSGSSGGYSGGYDGGGGYSGGI